MGFLKTSNSGGSSWFMALSQGKQAKCGDLYDYHARLWPCVRQLAAILSGTFLRSKFKAAVDKKPNNINIQVCCTLWHTNSCDDWRHKRAGIHLSYRKLHKKSVIRWPTKLWGSLQFPTKSASMWLKLIYVIHCHSKYQDKHLHSPSFRGYLWYQYCPLATLIAIRGMAREPMALQGNDNFVHQAQHNHLQ